MEKNSENAATYLLFQQRLVNGVIKASSFADDVYES